MVYTWASKGLNIVTLGPFMQYNIMVLGPFGIVVILSHVILTVMFFLRKVHTRGEVRKERILNFKKKLDFVTYTTQALPGSRLL